MEPDSKALLSRLKAECKFSKIECADSDTPEDLMRKLQGAGVWSDFVENYKIGFSPVTGKFVDLNAMAYVLAHGDSLAEQSVQVFRKAGPPGPPPREGLEWKEETSRWIRPEGGVTDDGEATVAIPSLEPVVKTVGDVIESEVHKRFVESGSELPEFLQRHDEDLEGDVRRVYEALEAGDASEAYNYIGSAQYAADRAIYRWNLMHHGQEPIHPQGGDYLKQLSDIEDGIRDVILHQVREMEADPVGTADSELDSLLESLNGLTQDENTVRAISMASQAKDLLAAGALERAEQTVNDLNDYMVSTWTILIDSPGNPYFESGQYPELRKNPYKKVADQVAKISNSLEWARGEAERAAATGPTRGHLTKTSKVFPERALQVSDDVPDDYEPNVIYEKADPVDVARAREGVRDLVENLRPHIQKNAVDVMAKYPIRMMRHKEWNTAMKSMRQRSLMLSAKKYGGGLCILGYVTKDGVINNSKHPYRGPNVNHTSSAHTIYHELGHQLFSEAMKGYGNVQADAGPDIQRVREELYELYESRVRGRRHDTVTDYAKRNRDEYLAEVFAHYFSNNGKLFKKDPEAFRILRTIMQ